MGTLSVFMSWIHRDRHLDWAARAGGTGEPRVAPSGAQTARQLPRCAGPRAAPPPPTAPLLSPALQVAEAGAVLAEGPRGLRTASSPQPGRRPLTALCRPRCPCRAGGERSGLNEVQPEEDAASCGEEGAPGRRLPGRGGRRARLQGLVPGTGAPAAGSARAGRGRGRGVGSSSLRPPGPRLRRGHSRGASAGGAAGVRGALRCTRGPSECGGLRVALLRRPPAACSALSACLHARPTSSGSWRAAVVWGDPPRKYPWRWAESDKCL